MHDFIDIAMAAVAQKRDRIHLANADARRRRTRGLSGGVEVDKGGWLDGHEADGRSKKCSITFCGLRDSAALVVADVAIVVPEP